MTKLSFEVPLKHLQDFDDLQDYFFTLSILYKQPVYSNYINKKAREGLHTIWLDNSFNETFKADDPQTLQLLYDSHHCIRIICPDDFNWTKEQQADAFLYLCGGISPSRIIVPIANMEMFEYMKQQGAVNFAVSYWIRQKNFTPEELKSIPNVHFLGMLDVAELIDIKPISCDTSMPVKIACIGLDMEEWMNDGCQHINTKDLGHHGEGFFNMTLDDWTLNLARENIKWLKELVRQKQ